MNPNLNWRQITGLIREAINAGDAEDPRSNMNAIGVHFGGSEHAGWRTNLRTFATSFGVDTSKLSTTGVIMTLAEHLTSVKATSWGHGWWLLLLYFTGGVILAPSPFFAMVQGSDYVTMIENSQFVARLME